MPLLMDLHCPVEFVRAEMTRDSAGHVQAYLTFFNLGERAVEGLEATVTLEDERGQSIGLRPLGYRGIHAPGRRLFTLCMAGDGLPDFYGARALIRRVWLEDGACFELDEDALMDCSVEEEPPGERRSALIGVAGEDAVCFAAQRGALWICVCGRYNENGDRRCVRCGRTYTQAFSLTPQLVCEQYHEALRRESEALESGRASAREQAQRIRERRKETYLARIHAQAWRTRIRRACWAGAAAIGAWLFWYFKRPG